LFIQQFSLSDTFFWIKYEACRHGQNQACQNISDTHACVWVEQFVPVIYMFDVGEFFFFGGSWFSLHCLHCTIEKDLSEYSFWYSPAEGEAIAVQGGGHWLINLLHTYG
jgi:hypothetical protein